MNAFVGIMAVNIIIQTLLINLRLSHIEEKTQHIIYMVNDRMPPGKD